MTARRFVDALNRGAPVTAGVMARKDGSLQGRRDVTGIDTESLGPGGPREPPSPPHLRAVGP
ncbi:MAG: hypothetical protein OXD36_09965 [Rhodobacter sp.]|nr:hypothetical protein [Rhodobacter sp.]